MGGDKENQKEQDGNMGQNLLTALSVTQDRLRTLVKTCQRVSLSWRLFMTKRHDLACCKKVKRRGVPLPPTAQSICSELLLSIGGTKEIPLELSCRPQ